MTETNFHATVVQSGRALIVELKSRAQTAAITLGSSATAADAHALANLLNRLALDMRVVQDRHKPLDIPDAGIV